MGNKLKNGLMIAAGSELANIVSESRVGSDAYDKINAGYGLEHFVNGATQAGAFAGLALAAYGLTGFAVKKAMPIASEKTAKAASLTSALSVAYALSQTGVFREALYNMSAYNHQMQRAVEVIATLGIFASLVATGALFAKDVYGYASGKIRAALEKKR